MDCYSTFKMRDVFIPATAWTGLGDIMLSEISQTQEGTFCVIPLTGGTQSGQVQRDTKRGWEGDRESVFGGDRVSVLRGEKVLETDGGDGCTML